MAIDSKRKGKAGGARVITYTTLVNENTGEVCDHSAKMIPPVALK